MRFKLNCRHPTLGLRVERLLVLPVFQRLDFVNHGETAGPEFLPGGLDVVCGRVEAGASQLDRECVLDTSASVRVVLRSAGSRVCSVNTESALSAETPIYSIAKTDQLYDVQSVYGVKC